jgi:hypothetical protein
LVNPFTTQVVEAVVHCRPPGVDEMVKPTDDPLADPGVHVTVA